MEDITGRPFQEDIKLQASPLLGGAHPFMGANSSSPLGGPPFAGGGPGVAYAPGGHKAAGVPPSGGGVTHSWAPTVVRRWAAHNSQEVAWALRTPLEDIKLQASPLLGGVTHSWAPTVVLRGATNLTVSVSNSSCHHQTQLERGWTRLRGKA